MQKNKFHIKKEHGIEYLVFNQPKRKTKKFYQEYEDNNFLPFTKYVFVTNVIKWKSSKEVENKLNNKSLNSNKIKERFDFLDNSLEDDQDRSTYEKSKKLLLEVLNCLNIDTPPLIGVDDSGQVIAEWHNYKRNKFVGIVCISKKNILFQAIRENDTVISIQSKLISICKDIENEL